MSSSVLITGASSGIGLELAKLFAKDHHNLILVARSRDILEKLAVELRTSHNIEVKVFGKDLSKQSDAESLVAEIEAGGIEVDMLVNNAGSGYFGYFKDVAWSKDQDMIQLNIASLTYLAKVFAKKMTERKSGKILNVASTAAFQPGPLMAVYYATKAYVLSFSEALANELEGTGVQVSVLCPGPTTSSFQKAAGLENSAMIKEKKLPGSAEVAAIGYRGFQQGKLIIIPKFTNTLFVQLLRIAPRSLVTKFIRWYQQERS